MISRTNRFYQNSDDFESQHFFQKFWSFLEPTIFYKKFWSFLEPTIFIKNADDF
jgi:hypothetical protein